MLRAIPPAKGTGPSLTEARRSSIHGARKSQNPRVRSKSKPQTVSGSQPIGDEGSLEPSIRLCQLGEEHEECPSDKAIRQHKARSS